ncbi:MAG TPA: hypothetical protein VGD76_06195 [Ramlibacter sp.]
MNELPTQPQLDAAKSKTDQVQRDLEVASAELGLTHGALERELPEDVKTGDVAWAIEQNKALERKVQQAAEELEEVTELLEQAEQSRDGKP